MRTHRLYKYNGPQINLPHYGIVQTGDVISLGVADRKGISEETDFVDTEVDCEGRTRFPAATADKDVAELFYSYPENQTEEEKGENKEVEPDVENFSNEEGTVEETAQPAEEVAADAAEEVPAESAPSKGKADKYRKRK